MALGSTETKRGFSNCYYFIIFLVCLNWPGRGSRASPSGPLQTPGRHSPSGRGVGGRAACPLGLNAGARPACAVPSRPAQGGAAGTPGIRQLRPGRAEPSRGAAAPARPSALRPGRWAGQGRRCSAGQFPTRFSFSSLSFGK